MKKLTYETFGTYYEAQEFIQDEELNEAAIPLWAERWECWVVWYVY